MSIDAFTNYVGQVTVVVLGTFIALGIRKAWPSIKKSPKRLPLLARKTFCWPFYKWVSGWDS